MNQKVVASGSPPKIQQEPLHLPLPKPIYPEDAMDDLSGNPGLSTPEHWSDVGPLRGRMTLVEQQLQTVQAD